MDMPTIKNQIRAKYLRQLDYLRADIRTKDTIHIACTAVLDFHGTDQQIRDLYGFVCWCRQNAETDRLRNFPGGADMFCYVCLHADFAALYRHRGKVGFRLYSSGHARFIPAQTTAA